MALVERNQLTTHNTKWKGEIPLEYLYTAGRAGERFLRAIKEEGKFIGTRNEELGITYVPPRAYCEHTMESLEDSYVDVPNRGTVETFTISYENYDGSPKDNPTIVAMVVLEGTDGGLVHWLGEIDPEEVMIGMVVEAVFKPENEREGSILDIKYFKPV
jgi:hypothetical protein